MAKKKKNEDIVSPTKWTWNSRGKMQKDLEERTKGGLTGKVSWPKTPMSPSIKQRNIFNEKAQSSVQCKNTRRDNLKENPKVS